MPDANLRKPEWLRKKIRLSQMDAMQRFLEKGDLRTICEEALCPNIGECFARGVATLLILGETCTRHCSFCTVDKGKPLPPDPDEPRRIAEAVGALGLRHVVLTSPTRDDLSDGGAEQFCATVAAIKRMVSSVTVELLIPDMGGDEGALERIAHSGAEIVGHNVETVPRLYRVRKGALYGRSLGVLDALARFNPALAVKSAIMLGLGENDDEVEGVLRDLYRSGCRMVCIGQYLSPSPNHEKVVHYAHPERFDRLGRIAEGMGFMHVKSAPYARSSYLADTYLPTKVLI